MQKQKLLELRKTILDYHYIINVYNPNAKLPDVDSLINECHTDNSNGKLSLNVYFIAYHIHDSLFINYKFLI